MDLIFRGRLFCYAFFRKRGDFVSVEEYIKGNDKFSRMPFSTVYAVIVELIADGYIDTNAFEWAGDSGVAVCKLKPKREKCRGLHCQGDRHCHGQCVG